MTEKKRPRYGAILISIFALLAMTLIIFYLVQSFRIERDIRKISGRLESSAAADLDEGTVRREMDRLAESMKVEKSRYFRLGEVDPADFGLTVKRALTSLGLEVESYKIIEAPGGRQPSTGPLFDFKVTGRLISFLRFLKALSVKQRCFIENISLNALEGDGIANANFRISFGVLDEETPVRLSLGVEDIVELGVNQDWSELRRIESMFRWAGPGGEDGNHPAEGDSSTLGSAGNPDQPVRADWLTYVGIIVQGGKEFFVFKDTVTGRIYRLSRETRDADGWLYLREVGERHYLKKDETIYIVPVKD